MIINVKNIGYIPSPFISSNHTYIDKDGNEYTSVTIGTQEWMVQNLRTTKYADGTFIPNLVDDLSTNLTPSGPWTNDALTWDTFTPDGMTLNIISAIDSGASLARAIVGTTSSFGPFIMKTSFTLTLNSGTAPQLRIIDDYGVIMFNERLVAGDNNIIIDTTPYIIDGAEFYLTNTDANWLNPYATNFSISNWRCERVGWASDEDGAYCWFNNDISNKNPYGALYNYFVIDTSRSTQLIQFGGNYQFSENGAPSVGWRIPTKTDFQNLITFIDNFPNDGGDLKEIGTTHWNSPNVGAIDKYGFKAVGTGYRQNVGTWTAFNSTNYLWDTYKPDGQYGNFMQLVNAASSLTLSDGAEEAIYKYGFSIRCVRDI